MWLGAQGRRNERRPFRLRYAPHALKIALDDNLLIF
jgi:hypothetical protein